MDPSMSRRELLAGTAVLAAGVGLTRAVAAAESPAADAPATVAKAYLGRHEPQPLPFDPAKLDGLSQKLIRSHWENNYQGSQEGPAGQFFR